MPNKSPSRNSPGHTPGPWFYVVEDNGDTIRIETEEGGYIAEVSRNPDETDPWEVPNAALLSAAPDLLEALKWVTAQMKDAIETNMGSDDEGLRPTKTDLEALKLADAAIRKAEGRKP